MTYLPSGPIIYRAPFIVPVATAPIADGGVMVHRGLIVAVDRFIRLRRESARVVDFESAIITPALINCHAHLELSYLEASCPVCDRGVSSNLDKSNNKSSPRRTPGSSFHASPREHWIPAFAGVTEKLPRLEGLPTNPSGDFEVGTHSPTGFTDWIRALLAKRGQVVPLETIIEAGRKALAQQYLRGVALVADIGNQPTSRTISAGGNVESLFFRELLAVTAKAAESVLATLPIDEQCTAHSPYSCHPSLITALKQRSRQTKTLFPIHVAESADEVAFLRTGTGPFHDFLLERLRVSSALADGQVLADLLPYPGCGAVEYLKSLNVLDEQTICVHGVHISENEIDILAKARAKICLCPASNRKLDVGKAPVPLLLKRQIMPGLGTDSLASNDSLDLWQEMRVLQEDHPGITPEQIFTMATLGGAATLGVTNRLGALAPGLEARMLAIDYSGQPADVFSSLVTTGTAQKVTLLEGV